MIPIHERYYRKPWCIKDDAGHASDHVSEDEGSLEAEPVAGCPQPGVAEDLVCADTSSDAEDWPECSTDAAETDYSTDFTDSSGDSDFSEDSDYAPSPSMGSLKRVALILATVVAVATVINKAVKSWSQADAEAWRQWLEEVQARIADPMRGTHSPCRAVNQQIRLKPASTTPITDSLHAGYAEFKAAKETWQAQEVQHDCDFWRVQIAILTGKIGQLRSDISASRSKLDQAKTENAALAASLSAFDHGQHLGNLKGTGLRRRGPAWEQHVNNFNEPVNVGKVLEKALQEWVPMKKRLQAQETKYLDLRAMAHKIGIMWVKFRAIDTKRPSERGPYTVDAGRAEVQRLHSARAEYEQLKLAWQREWFQLAVSLLQYSTARAEAREPSRDSAHQQTSSQIASALQLIQDLHSVSFAFESGCAADTSAAVMETLSPALGAIGRPRMEIDLAKFAQVTEQEASLLRTRTALNMHFLLHLGQPLMHLPSALDALIADDFYLERQRALLADCTFKPRVLAQWKDAHWTHLILSDLWMEEGLLSILGKLNEWSQSMVDYLDRFYGNRTHPLEVLEEISNFWRETERDEHPERVPFSLSNVCMTEQEKQVALRFTPIRYDAYTHANTLSLLLAYSDFIVLLHRMSARAVKPVNLYELGLAVENASFGNDSIQSGRKKRIPEDRNTDFDVMWQY